MRLREESAPGCEGRRTVTEMGEGSRKGREVTYSWRPRRTAKGQSEGKEGRVPWSLSLGASSRRVEVAALGKRPCSLGVLLDL